MQAANLIQTLQKELRDFPAGVPGFDRDELTFLTDRMAWRLQAGIDAPVRVALIGPTGVGKSKLFNTLVGRVTSPSGFRRPCTLQSQILVHRAFESLLSAEHGSTANAIPHEDAAWRDILLVDTPDFDSVNRKNRREAERVFRAADAYVFVTDVHKYADLSTWEFLGRVLQGQKPAILVLNKVPEGMQSEVVDDFRARVRATVQDREEPACATIRWQAGDDNALLSSEPDFAVAAEREFGLETVRRFLQSLVASQEERRERQRAGLAADIDSFFCAWELARQRASAHLKTLEAIAEKIRHRVETASAALGAEVETQIAPAVRDEVYGRVLERLSRIDIFRYPRRLLMLPWRGAKALIGRWRGKSKPSENGVAEGPPARLGQSATYQLFEARVLRLIRDLRRDFQTPELPGAVAALAQERIRISHTEIAAAFQSRQDEYLKWLQSEAVETAVELSSENKLKFILSQVLYNMAVVGVQVHTGGVFTLVELGTDAVLSPLLAKAVGIAISSERVAWFERSAQDKHRELLGELFAEIARPALSVVQDETSWRDAFGNIVGAAESLRQQRAELLASFERGECLRIESSVSIGDV